MKDKSNRKAILNTSAVFLLIIGIMLYFYIKDPNRNYLYYEVRQYSDVIVATRDILPGEIMEEEDIKLIEVEVTELLNNDALYSSNIEDLLGKKALFPMKMGQLLSKDYFLEKTKWYEGKHEYALEVDIPQTVANSIRIGDYIDINVSYDKSLSLEDLYNKDIYHNFDIVIPKVMVENMKTSDSISYASYLRDGASETFVPGYIIVNLEYSQIDDYLGAKKIGEIFLIKYGDITAEPNKKTYSIFDRYGLEDDLDMDEELKEDTFESEDNDELGGE